MLTDQQCRKISVRLFSIWLIIFALLPLAFIFLVSFLQKGDHTFLIWHFSFSNYRQLFSAVYFHVFFRSLSFAAITTLLCLLIGYPFAVILSRVSERWRWLLLLLMIIPFWTSSLVRTYAIVGIIQSDGILSHLLMRLHLIHHPLQLLYTPTAVIIGLTYSLLPFMVLPLYANLEKFDWQLMDAAQDLGASKWQGYSRVLFPLTLPGVLSGILLVLLPAMTLFYVPDVLGGARSMLLGNLIKEQFLDAQNWPLGSAASVALTVFMGLLLLIYWRFSNASATKARGGGLL